MTKTFHFDLAPLVAGLADHPKRTAPIESFVSISAASSRHVGDQLPERQPPPRAW
ncbi:hypothetical protein AKJ09_04966 [Labilithrix luteola]|uniref:Uncharacterized protein n=1 Tax=Labilithrix luteola TaxID=1391654 RepID=A0A0K1PXR8_9BACT|nr:hypothetical protein AKJ09_04966 [Labilithrix luteola]